MNLMFIRHLLFLDGLSLAFSIGIDCFNLWKTRQILGTGTEIEDFLEVEEDTNYYDLVPSRSTAVVTSQSSAVHTRPTPQPQEDKNRQQNWSDYSTKMLRTPSHPALKRRTTVPDISFIGKIISAPPQASSSDAPKNTFTPTQDKNNSRRRPTIQKPPTSEVTANFDLLAKAKLELVSLQLVSLQTDIDRKTKHEEANFERRQVAEDSENKLKFKLLDLEVQIKQETLKQEKHKSKKMQCTEL